jgi:sulfur carrier protein
MVVTINGKNTQVSDGITVSRLLEDSDVEMMEYVSVQMNDEILPRDDFSIKTVHEGDVIEFLYYMGGGSIGREAQC